MKTVKKGIILAGGLGTRLYPSTCSTSKQLLPIYDKPMIYYPISVLMLAGIRDILIITTPDDENNFKKLLKDGSQFGVKFEYITQKSPDGLAQAFILGEDFIADDSVALILGDNLFYGQSFSHTLKEVSKNIAQKDGAYIFAHKVKDPQRYGVVEFNDNNEVLSIEEKPLQPKSDYAVTGLYFYDNQVVKYAKKLKPSKRGELEITDLNNIYLKNQNLKVQILGRGFSWLDTGTPKALLQASQYMQTIEENQGYKVACLEEIALNEGFIEKDKIKEVAKKYQGSEYYQYVLDLIE